MSGGFLNPLLVQDAVRRALEEDLGRAGDLTSLACVPAGRNAEAVIAAREPGIVAGLALAREAFRQIDADISFKTPVADGHKIDPGAVVAQISGDARAVLSAERVALNFLGRLSGIATLTSRYVAAVAHTSARICDTRKTTPTLRAFEKFAVRCGGGMNHRYGLDDAILIKDNHIAVAGGVKAALVAAKAAAGHMVVIEIEVDTLDQLDEAVAEGVDIVLLDNMRPDTLREAVRRTGNRIKTEASGGVTLETVRAIAETGVDMISVGALTHSAPVLDFGLDITIR